MRPDDVLAPAHLDREDAEVRQGPAVRLAARAPVLVGVRVRVRVRARARARARVRVRVRVRVRIRVRVR